MILGETFAEWALLLGAIGALITAVGGTVVLIIGAVSMARKVNDVHATVASVDAKVDVVDTKVGKAVHELETLNGSTVGELADADETRRVEAIPPDDRTDAEAEHVAVVPPLDGP